MLFTERLVAKAVRLIRQGVPVPLTLVAALTEAGISIRQLEGKYSQ
jgi:hypothetical protein